MPGCAKCSNVFTNLIFIQPDEIGVRSPSVDEETGAQEGLVACLRYIAARI